MQEQELIDLGIRGYPGMLTVEEATKLAELARDKVVLEIGSWCGLSTVVMAKEAKQVYALDWHCGDEEMGPHDTLGELRQNALNNRVNHKLIYLVGRSQDVLPKLAANSFGLVYVDGAHDYYSVRHDGEHAFRLAPVVVFHDADRAEVRRAIKDAILPYMGTPFELPPVGPGRLMVVQQHKW
jgi:predicted O-methyltransferase YrrM